MSSLRVAAQLPMQPAARLPTQMRRAATPQLQAPEDTMRLQVTVPDGMNAGELLQCSTPEGLMEVTIPEGCSAGSIFEILVPTAAASPLPAPPTIRHYARLKCTLAHPHLLSN